MRCLVCSSFLPQSGRVSGSSVLLPQPILLQLSRPASCPQVSSSPSSRLYSLLSRRTYCGLPGAWCCQFLPLTRSSTGVGTAGAEMKPPSPHRLLRLRCCRLFPHTPSIAFRHLPPNSARFGYAAEGAFFISAQLFTDAVSALRKVRVLIRLWKKPSAQVRT